MAAVKRIVSGIIGMGVRVIVLAFFVMFIYRASLQAYDFGFRIFAEQPMSVGSGRDVEITIPMGKNTMEIGEILKDHGLIRDEKLFYFQELLSAYHGKLQPGFYTLNTSMSAVEMMATMSLDQEADEDGTNGDSKEESVSQE